LLLIATLILAVPFVTSVVVENLLKSAAYDEALKAKTVEIILDMETQLITLAAAFVGGLSAFIAARYRSSKISEAQLTTAAVSCACGAASLIFGYLTYATMIWMMSSGVFKPAVLHPLTLGQFWMFIVAVASFAVFAYREVRQEA
jgi:ABC-type multidrug transport system fused ATPase/permease subunit